MVWEWPIAWYLFLGGLGAGAALTAVAASRSGDRFALVERCGAWISGPAVAIGTGLLVVDLGVGRREPWRIVYLYLNVASPMTWGTWILTLFVPVALGYALVLTGPLPRRLLARAAGLLPAARWTAAVLAVATAVYTGVLLAVPPTFPLLANPVLPVLFLVSALSTGMAATLLGASLVAARRGEHLDLSSWARPHLVLLGVEVVALVAWLAVATGSSAGDASVAMLLSGSLAPVFWVVIVAAGLLGPALVLARRRSGHALVMAGEAGVLAGGLALRYLVLLAAVPVLVGPAL